jgi:nicotinate phosphoribosyltransferase
MVGGHAVAPADPPAEVRAARERLAADLAWLPEAARRLTAPEPVTVRPSARLEALRGQVAGLLARRR